MRLSLLQVAQCLSKNASAFEVETFIDSVLKNDRGLIRVVYQGNWENIICTGAQTDSRAVALGNKSNLFVCIKGERVDGHDYAYEAAKAGAVAIIATHDPFLSLRDNLDTVFPPVLLVTDPLKALWRVALVARKNTKAKVIGVTGTAGKTTVKETMAHVLTCKGTVEKNHKNFNTQIGLSLSMINADSRANYWVMEAGISKPQDMDELGALLQPDISLILNAGDAHSEGLGEKGVAYYKAQLAAYTSVNGNVFVSEDYPELKKAINAMDSLLDKRNVTLRWFSINESGTNYSNAQWKEYSSGGLSLFAVQVDGQSFYVKAPFYGTYGAENVAAICSIAVLEGILPEELYAYFATVVLPEQRFAIRTKDDSFYIDDSYNSNPLSAMRMIEAASSLAQKENKELSLVMGEMLELGLASREHHYNLGIAMAKSGAKNVYWLGGQAKTILDGLIKADYQGIFYPVSSVEDFLDIHLKHPFKNSVILFKGSRSNKVETLLRSLFNDSMREETQHALLPTLSA